MISNDAFATLIGRFPVLRRVPRPFVDRITGEGQCIHAPRTRVFFDVGAACRVFPMIIGGSLRVVQTSPAGRELVLYRVSPGDTCVLTTSCLLGGSRYPARGVVESDLVAVAIDRGLFTRLVEEFEPFRTFVFSLFGVRLATLMRLVEDMAFRRVDQRLAGLLLSRGPELHVTHDDLAAELGTAREVVSRILKSFEREGLVHLVRCSVTVLDARGIQRVADLDATAIPASRR